MIKYWPSSSNFAVRIRTTFLVAMLWLLVPQRSVKAEDSLTYKFQSWQEDGGRIRVDAHYAQLETVLSTETKIKVMGLIDTISGATPSGQPAPAGSDQVPLSQLTDRREAGQLEVSHPFKRLTVVGGYAKSKESDYISDVWSAKALIEVAGEDEVKDAIADTLREQFANDLGLLVLLGPGSSVRSVAAHLGLEKTLLGIDAMADGELVGRDINECQILELLARYPRRALVLSPIGAQGFVLGRGNLPLSPEVIRAVGRDNIVVIATPAKLARTPILRFDTGDPSLDQELAARGYVRVLTGYRRRRLVKVMI